MTVPRGSGPHRVLVIGPLPPPLDGTSVSFRLLCEELESRRDLHARVVDSSPRQLKDGSTRRLSTAGALQASRILFPFLRHLPGSDRVLIFGSNGFLLRAAPILVGVAKLLGKPVHVRVFGGSLDRFCTDLAPAMRRILLGTLRRADGVHVQTRLLYDRLRPWIGASLHVAPGYRRLPDRQPDVVSTVDEGLRLIYVGHVREEKGIAVLLDALAALAPGERRAIRCEIYGPVYDSFRSRFYEALSRCENAVYRGILAPDRVVPTLREYDALVFPSFYAGEGHPGVLIEAMMAGIPAIATSFRSIPELIDDRINGLLVAPERSEALTEAIRTLHRDGHLVATLARGNRQRRLQHDARRVIPAILRQMGLEDARDVHGPDGVLLERQS